MNRPASHTGEEERWGSQIGFVLAAIGSAAGLGNIWRFSYVAGENGGAAFLLIYLVCVLLLGIPLIVAELAVGRRAHSDAVAAFVASVHARRWGAVGAVGVLSACLVLSFYSVVAGWALMYFWGAVDGTLFLPISALLVGLFVGWKWRPEQARASSDLADSPLGRIWLGLVRYVASPAILMILLRGLDIL
jgi:NSS family neurotransmitter:Na+ symporter